MNEEWSRLAASSISHAAQMAQATAQEAAYEWMRPSVLFRPALSRDGNMWCAMYGENLMEGVAGFGDTPAKAMAAFDHAWLTEKAVSEREAGQS